MHREAAMVLYCKNSFYFSDPDTASNFRWMTDPTQAALVQEVAITAGILTVRNEDTWTRYVEAKSFSLKQDFPYLRRLTLDLVKLAIAGPSVIRPMFESFARNVQELDCVHVNRLNNENLLKFLEPMVKADTGSSTDKRQIQTYITKHKSYLGWRNATLWSGSLGKAQYKRSAVLDNPLCAQVLYCLGSGDDISYCSCKSFLIQRIFFLNANMTSSNEVGNGADFVPAAGSWRMEDGRMGGFRFQ